MALWLMLLVLLGALVYLNQVGLPGIVKRPLLEKLRARGLELEFSRLRLSWYRGIVAEQVRFGRAHEALSPQFTFAEVRVQLNHRALARRQLQVDALALRQGRLVWPVPETNQAPRQLALENIQTDLRFLPDDQWSLDNFKAAFAGARISMSGTITHASAVRDWTWLQPGPGATAAGAWPGRFRQLAQALERIRFAAPPDLRLDVRGDARDLQSFSVRLSVTIPGAETPWGTVAQGRFAARRFPTARNESTRPELTLSAANAQTRWANLTNFQLVVHLASFAGLTNLLNGDLNLKAAQAQTPWGVAANVRLDASCAPVPDDTNLLNAHLVLSAEQARTSWGAGTNARLTAHWLQALSNPVPLSGQGQLDCQQVETRWGRARQAQLLTRLLPPSPGRAPMATLRSGPAEQALARRPSSGMTAARGPVPAAASALDKPGTQGSRPDWAWWGKLEPYALDWEWHLAGAELPELAAEEAGAGGSWRAPVLTITNLHAKFRQGELEAGAGLNFATRALEARVESSVDPQQLAPVLPEGARRWLAQFAWKQPPRLSAQAALVLPAWTNRAPDWPGEVQPTIRLAGEFKAPSGGAYRGLAVSRAQAHFSYSNLCWRLPDLLLTWPEGQVRATHQANERTKEFYWRFASTVDPALLRPLLGPEAQSGLALFSFTQPPVVEAQLWGQGTDPARTGIKGRVALTNFIFRGQIVSGLQTEFQYTNLFLQFLSPSLQRAGQQMTAEGLAADFRARAIYLTNGFGTAEPMFVAQAIGPHVARALAPYHFIAPPTVLAHGVIPMEGERGADLYFHAQTGPFRWLNFKLERVAADIHWAGLRLFLTDVRTEFYGGDAFGAASFDFNPEHPGTDFQFSLTTSNTLLQALMTDVSTRTNHLEGRLSGTLNITQANSEDWRQTDGDGTVELRDGLIWDIPLFGILSPALDSLVPGLGSSRANAGTCSFFMTNGVIRTDNLEIRAPAMRLRYRGKTDLPGEVNARVEAELLRDVPLFGPLVSTVFWPVTKLFEYKVTGSRNEPKMEPLYLLPRLVLMPFHPWHTLKGILPKDTFTTRTNSSPVTRP